MADAGTKAFKADNVRHAHIEDALAAAQAEFPEIEKSKTGKISGTSKRSGKDFEYSYKYADIADVLKVIRPILGRHGIAVTQETQIAGNVLTIKSTLRFRGADGPESIDSLYPVCSIGSDHKEMGGALTYARRYAFCAIVGIAPDEDVDGDGAAPSAAPERKAAPVKAAEPPKAEPKVYTLDERFAGCKSHLSKSKDKDDAIVRWEEPRTETLRDELAKERPDLLAGLTDFYGQVLSRFDEAAFA